MSYSAAYLEAASRSVLLKKCFKKVASACNFIKKETLAQVFSFKFCTFLTEHLRETSATYLIYMLWSKLLKNIHEEIYFFSQGLETLNLNGIDSLTDIVLTNNRNLHFKDFTQ